MNRSKILKKHLSLNFIYRIGGIGINYLTIPILLQFLGDRNYGIWVTIFSIVAWINNFDVGVGNGLKNKLTEALTLNDIRKAKEYITTSYVIISIISLFILFIGISLISWGNISKLFNIAYLTEAYLKKFVLVIFILTLSNFVIGLYKQMFYATHKAAIVAFSTFLYQLLVYVILLLVKNKFDNSLVLIAVIYGGANLLIGIFYTILFFKNHRELHPRLVHFSRNRIKDIMGIGIEFFIIQLAMIVIFTTDNIIISSFINVEAVTTYNLILKVFQAFIYGFGILVIPLWPMFTDAYTKKDFKWIQKTLKYLNLIFLLIMVVVVFCTFTMDSITRFWLGASLSPPRYLVLFCGVFTMLKIYTDIYATFINGTGKIKVQLYAMIAAAAINIPLSIFFINIGLNSSGVILASVISILIIAVSLPIHSFFILKDLKNESK